MKSTNSCLYVFSCLSFADTFLPALGRTYLAPGKREGKRRYQGAHIFEMRDRDKRGAKMETMAIKQVTVPGFGRSS